MKTAPVSDQEILFLLAAHDHLRSEEFFNIEPQILDGGLPARIFGLKIHDLLKAKFITTKKREDTRLWQITSFGKEKLKMLMESVGEN